MRLRGLRQARQRSGLSISQLAELTGLRRDTITHLEQGKEDPQPYVLRRLASALRATDAQLIDFGPPDRHKLVLSSSHEAAAPYLAPTAIS
jgi:transcriptional regulator with XRE-family HTH domain